MKLERLALDKHFSLLQTIINSTAKSFITLDIGESLQVVVGQVFNFRVGRFANMQVWPGAYERTILDLKTLARFWPLGLRFVGESAQF